MSLYNNVSYHTRFFFHLSINSSFTHKLGMTAYFYYLNSNCERAISRKFELPQLFCCQSACKCQVSVTREERSSHHSEEKKTGTNPGTMLPGGNLCGRLQVTVKTGARDSRMVFRASLGSRQQITQPTTSQQFLLTNSF